MKRLLYFFLFLSVSSFAQSLDFIVTQQTINDSMQGQCSDLGDYYRDDVVDYNYSNYSSATSMCQDMFNLQDLPVPGGMVGLSASKIEERPFTSKEQLSAKYCGYTYDYNIHYHCDYSLSCTDEPADGDISYPKNESGQGCKNYSDLNDSQREIYPAQGGLICNSCYTQPYDEYTCLSPRVLDTSTNPPRCITPSCTPLSEVTIPLTANDCSGNIAFLSAGQAGSGSASYQQCDHTCYLLEPVPAPCSDVGVKLRSKCDLDLNDFNFSCSQPDIGQGLTTYSSSCNPKNLKPVPNPCKIEHDKWFTDCSASGTVLRGDCVDNGLSIIDEDYHCEDNVTNNPDCDTDWNEISDGNGGCKCEDGYSRDRYNNCTLFNWDDNDSTPPTPTASDSDSAAHADSKKNNNSLKQQSSDLNGVRSDLNITNATLAGLRSDLNTTNNILSSMKNNLSDKLDATNGILSDILDKKSGYDATDKQTQTSDDSFNNVTNFLNDTQDSLHEIENKFNDAKALIDSGFTYTPPVVASCVDPSVFLYGRDIKLKICEPLQKFSPILYIIFTLVFTYIAILIFILGFRF